jgi:hypothetical protein
MAATIDNPAHSRAHMGVASWMSGPAIAATASSSIRPQPRTPSQAASRPSRMPSTRVTGKKRIP